MKTAKIFAILVLAVCSLAPLLTLDYQFFDASSGASVPCANCTVATFLAGTSTPTHTYADYLGVTQNQTVITLNSQGYTPSGVWVGASCIKIVITNSHSFPG